ncbi:MAG: M3 family metallopeptidase [Planctomycetes bacterium]|nr:M3 family metallopeptidase [Planctomycetota bacterium]
MSDNPLLFTAGTPRFETIRPEHVEPAVRQRIEEYKATLEDVLASGGPYTWDNLVEPLDRVDENLSRAWGPVSHLNGVMNSDELRAAYEATQPLITEFVATLGQDARLFKATQEVAVTKEIDEVQKRILELRIRDFRLAGVELDDEKKDRYREIQVELSQVGTTFMNNVLDVTKAYRLVIEDAADLEGLPDSLLTMARGQAEQDAAKDEEEAPEGRHTITLQAPFVIPFLQFQPKRALREELYKAFCTRATEGEHDNGPLIDRTLELRAELAKLLGMESYAHLSVETKMARSPGEVMAFLADIGQRAKDFGLRDVNDLREVARRDGVEEFQAFDSAYYREKLREERYSFSDEEVRQYFKLPKVLAGLFATIERIYGLKLSEVDAKEADVDKWHDDVRVVRVEDADGVRGHMLLDLFAREGKRQGAWMDVCVDRRRVSADEVQAPVAYLVCNFTAPSAGAPSLLRHREVVTLFHECGHALHHVLTKVDYRACAGINEVPWDGVELPSQFHENWVWQRESLAELSEHVETGEPLPDALLDKMLAAKNFQRAADMLRQLTFGTFDLELHSGASGSVQETIDAVRERISPLQPPAYNRFQNAFGHIFAGGYAAGYYSYMWADVLASDAFSRFEEEGLFSPEAGAAFRENILERGGSAELMDLYVAFRGREPNTDALLRHSGLVESTS